MNGDNYGLQQIREEVKELKGGLTEGLQITLGRIKEVDEFKSRTLIALERLSINYEHTRELTEELENLIQGGENKDSIILRINLLENNLKITTAHLEEKLAAQKVVNQEVSERRWQIRMAIITAVIGLVTSGVIAIGSNINFNDNKQNIERTK